MLGTVLGRLFGLGGSKQQAKNRLQFVLVQDRAGLTNEELTQFKKELVEVIQRYFVIADKGFDISYKRGGDSTTLLINSPIIVKRENAALSRGGVSRNGSRAHAAKMASEKAGASSSAKSASLQGELFEQGTAASKGVKVDTKDAKGEASNSASGVSGQAKAGQKLADKIEVDKSEPVNPAKGLAPISSDAKSGELKES